MTAQTIEAATGSVFAFPARVARLRLWLARLRHLSVRIELDPHLARDIGQNSYDAPVLEASWGQAIRERAGRPGLLHWMMAILSGQRDTFACNPAGFLDRHTARDIGIEFEMIVSEHARTGGRTYV